MTNEARGLPRKILITGASQGIGLACAHRLAGLGHEVTGVDLQPPELAGDRIHPVPVDVADAGAVNRLVTEHGPYDIVINSAGIVGPNRPMWEITDEDWERTLRINLNGVFNTMRAAIPAMVTAGWGRIVNIASIAGKEGNPNLSAYSASKGAVIALTKSVAKELATTGVLVHSVAPAVIATPMNDGTAPEVMSYMLSKIPMNRPGTADEVAALVSWLVSEECSFTTGACHDISGGRATY
jgi:NAD(P)-dependent dehydrogenase (short-subunit alcohol dehydrogenase family)